ncbi:ion channel [Candidatus Latescibacterota bacterium]
MTEANQTKTCSYVRSDGSRCPGPIEGDGELCYWHDPDADKEGDEVKKRLEEWSKSGESMEGFQLRYAHLEGAKLFHFEEYRDLSKANLFRARLQGASLFRLIFQGTDLLKADLNGANLNEAKMQGANILSTTLDGARLERTEWGDACVQEVEAYRQLRGGERDKARATFLEAEEIYRTLRRCYDGAGRFEMAGHFFRKEMTMRRMCMPMWSVDRMWSKVVDMFCAYGESPPRVIGFSVLLNMLCAVAYFGIGVKGPDGPMGFDADVGILTNLKQYGNCMYYSVVTFTTLGYGDVTPPEGILRPLAAFQAFIGAFMMAMFVAVFGKKMTRG